ncbi:terminase large subunit domain-containing protein [Pantoea coffeiphila]|uniref:Terminase-like family protein n=1 Tax=Pantoea coffeiphila TaxID=1465635 RepID=A0A2S9IBY2_9GAMM|nr:terminase family protein [Pantoea coffeiphila]PRD15311.1 terminase-like family protein [Pantoea coffeiphila]
MAIHLSDAHICQLKIMLGERAFEYQWRWFISQRRTRHITKTRQCGADWYFSLEALIDAAETGRDQNFLAPKTEITLPHNREFITGFCRDIDIAVKPDDCPIELSNGAVIRFLDEESHCAGLCGNAYVSEYAWSAQPSQLFLLGKSISLHQKYRFTTYTTPSESDEAYRMWRTGKPENLQRLSAETAYQQGNYFLDLMQLRSDFSPDDFEMLFSANWPHEKNQVKK